MSLLPFRVIKKQTPSRHWSYEGRYIHRPQLFDKPANKKQVLFSKSFLLKKSITNKPAFFIWFVKMYFNIYLLIYFHYSCIVNSQKLIKSCNLCNLTSFPFSLLLFNKVIYRVATFFLHYQTSHCLESNFSKC